MRLGLRPPRARPPASDQDAQDRACHYRSRSLSVQAVYKLLNNLRIVSGHCFLLCQQSPFGKSE